MNPLEKFAHSCLDTGQVAMFFAAEIRAKALVVLTYQLSRTDSTEVYGSTAEICLASEADEMMQTYAKFTSSE